MVAAAATLTVVLLNSYLVSVEPITRGVAVTAVTLALIITLDSAADGPAKRIFSLAPVVYLGRISYGTYL